MTRVVAIREVEDCFEESQTRIFEVEPEIDEALMRRMAEGGRLQYFPTFPRPYFRIDRDQAWIIQGVVGSSSFRVTCSAAAEDPEQALRRRIEQGA